MPQAKWYNLECCCLRGGEEVNHTDTEQHLDKQHQQSFPREAKGPGKGHQHFVSMCKSRAASVEEANVLAVLLCCLRSTAH